MTLTTANDMGRTMVEGCTRFMRGAYMFSAPCMPLTMMTLHLISFEGGGTDITLSSQSLSCSCQKIQALWRCRAWAKGPCMAPALPSLLSVRLG
jgi:hypothetical protein